MPAIQCLNLELAKSNQRITAATRMTPVTIFPSRFVIQLTEEAPHCPPKPPPKALLKPVRFEMKARMKDAMRAPVSVKRIVLSIE